MLEKTAASLEPCGLLLPRASKSFRSRRQLHNAFWQHGAADVEFSNAWQALMHGVFHSHISSTDAKTHVLRASSFLLDFLYPNSTVAYMRRLSLGPGRTSSFAKVSPRLYNSSAPPPKTEVEEKEKEKEIDAVITDTPETSGNQGIVIQDHSVSANVENPSTTQTSQDVAEPLTTEEYPDQFRQGVNHLEQFIELLTHDNPEDSDKVWHHYRLLDEQTRRIYIGQTLVFFSKTGSVSDAWKISELFNEMDSRRWDSYSFLAGLNAEMTLQNEQQALGIFTKGLARPDIDVRSLVDALDLLLASALRSSTTDLLINIWSHYSQMTERFDLDGVTRQLNQVSSVPGLVDKIFELSKHFLRNSKNPEIAILRRLLVRRALVKCPDNQAVPLLRLTDDPSAYEEFLRTYCNRGRRRIASRVYQQYRDLADSVPSHAALHVAFVACREYVFGSFQLARMEDIWSDWHRLHTQPSRRAYQRFLAFYASLGDKEKVYKLWMDYVELYASEDVLHGDDTFAHLLQVHAVRGELGEVQRIFDDISAKFGIKPNIHCWNILLNAHAKTGDYEGAIETFDRIAKSVGTERYSYGTLMQLAASRGDLGFTVDLYRRARREEVPTNEAMLDALVEAYCQNDYFHEAEDVCIRAAGRGIRPPRMWNQILHAYALRRDLNSVNRLLDVMTKHDVPYNKHTYQQLLLGLSLCQQPQHALHLLAVAIRENAFSVQADHFHTLMGAFIKTGEADVAVRIHTLMQKCGFPASAESILHLTTAFAQWHRLPRNRQLGTSMRRLLGSSLREFYRFYTHREAKTSTTGRDSDKPKLSDRQWLRPGFAAFQFGRMIYIFTQMKDFATVKELVDLYRYVSQADPNVENRLPIPLLKSIMLADWYEKKYDRVQDSWKLMFKAAKEAGGAIGWSEVSPDSEAPKISSAHQYVLSDGLKIMQELLVLQGDLPGLQALVEGVLAEGFKLDSKNWNLHVQALVKLKAQKEAFDVCEKWLMPNWTGWFLARVKANMKNKIPLDFRRRGTQPRHLRPTAHTFYQLVRGYVELDKLSPWSPDAARQLKEIEREAPQAHRAIMSMILVHSDVEREILSPEASKIMSEEVQNPDSDYDGDYDEHGEYLEGEPS